MLDLDAYTDPHAMRPRLQRALAEFGAPPDTRIDGLRVLHALRRAPRKNPASAACRIAVCYEAELAAPAGRREILYGKVYPAAAARRAPGIAGRARPAWLADIDMLLWRFPDDPALPQLAELMDPQRRRRLLPCGLLLEGCAPAELLRYRPEERATLSWRCRQGVFYAKTFAGEEGAALQQRFAHFHQHETRFAVAEPLGYDPASRSFWARGIETTSLAEAIDAGSIDGWCRRIAEALAALQRAPLAVAATHHVSGLVDAAHKRAAKLARCLPEHAADAARIAAAIAGRAARYADAPLGLIHGDFHIDQLRLADGGLAFFDFDEFARGDPLQDLASFAVKCRHRDRGIALALPQRLARAYAACRPEAFEHGRYEWHLAVQWLHKASRAFVWQQPGWRRYARGVIGQALAIVCRWREGGHGHGG